MASQHPGNDGTPLLQCNDPPPVGIVNPLGTSTFLFIGDHAGNRVPERLDALGVSEGDLARHIGWDIGIGALGALLAERLDATFVRQTYSRLVVDCNRGPDAADAIPTISDGTPIPGNAGLTSADRARRFAEIHEPYQQAIAKALDGRDAAGMETILVSLHSFTPVMNGFARPWEIGLLHDRGDTGFTACVLARLRRDGVWTVGDNEPYRMDGIDYTVPRHAYARGLPYVEFELRQDLIADDAGQRHWADTLTTVLQDAHVHPI